MRRIKRPELLNEMIESFFNCAVQAISKEELELNKLFEMNKALYQNQHYGVCFLYETTFVYLILKELLRMQYPFSTSWEQPYKNDKYLHGDLALLNRNGDVEALIEFKIWLNSDIGIRSDIQKLQKEVTESKKYMIILGYGGDIKDNEEYLDGISPGMMSLICSHQINTKYYYSKAKQIIDNNLNIFLCEVKSI